MILSRLDQTGMTTHTLDLTAALVKKNHNVTLLVGQDELNDIISKDLTDKVATTGAEIETFYMCKKRSILGSIKSSISLIFHILKHPNHIIHIQSPYLSWAPWLLCRKFISKLHVNDLIKCFYYKNASHLIAISNETKEYAKRVFDYQESNITIINHGVSARFAETLNIDQKKEQRIKLHLPPDKIILTIVGSIEPRKGHDILLRSVALLPKSTKEKIHIVFLGSDKTNNKTNLSWLEKAINDTDCNDLVTRFEYQDSKLFYQISDIFVLPSWLEGFPLVTIEAMLSGNLCIRSDAEGAKEQIINGKTGYIFPKGDVKRLADILEQVIENDNLRLKISQNGRDYALQHFVSDVMANETIKVYKMISNDK